MKNRSSLFRVQNNWFQWVALSTLFVVFLSCGSDATEEYIDYDIDTDGDGLTDRIEIENGTDRNNPCDPSHSTTYEGYDPLNLLWLAGDCDADGLDNSSELVANSNPYGDPKDLAVAEMLPNLSQLKLFKGNMADFVYNDNVYEYSMSTPLFTDYAEKLRVVALPEGAKMTYNGGGLLEFPDNTILAKTFYYLNDERNAALGKKIIETRVLIKKNGTWQVGNYFWNEDQTDALLDPAAHALQVTWVNGQGTPTSFTYKVPSNAQCIQCHENNGQAKPIGPKARALNFVHKGKNLMQDFKDKELIQGAPDIAQIPVLPNWENTALPLADRARAYLDVNCAHCHKTGGSYNTNFGEKFQLTYETPFAESNINDFKVTLKDRINTSIPGYFMPLIGTSLNHTEGIGLLNDYIDSLD